MRYYGQPPTEAKSHLRNQQNKAANQSQRPSKIILDAQPPMTQKPHIAKRKKTLQTIQTTAD